MMNYILSPSELKLYLLIISLMVGYFGISKFFFSYSSPITVFKDALKVLIYYVYSSVVSYQHRISQLRFYSKTGKTYKVPYAWEPSQNKKVISIFWFHLGRVMMGPGLIMALIYIFTLSWQPALFWFAFHTFMNLLKPQGMSRSLMALWNLGTLMLGMHLAVHLGFPLTVLKMLSEGLFNLLTASLSSIPILLMMEANSTQQGNSGPPSPPSTPEPNTDSGSEPHTPTEIDDSIPTRAEISNHYYTLALDPNLRHLSFRHFPPNTSHPHLPPSSGLVGPAAEILPLLYSGYLPSSRDPGYLRFGVELLNHLYDTQSFGDEAEPSVPVVRVLDLNPALDLPLDSLERYIPLGIGDPRAEAINNFIMYSIGNYMANAMISEHEFAFSEEYIDYIMQHGRLALSGIPYEGLIEFDPSIRRHMKEEAKFPTPNVSPDKIKVAQLAINENKHLERSYLLTLEHYQEILSTPMPTWPTPNQATPSQENLMEFGNFVQGQYNQRLDAYQKMAVYLKQLNRLDLIDPMKMRLHNDILHFNNLMSNIQSRLETFDEFMAYEELVPPIRQGESSQAVTNTSPQEALLPKDDDSSSSTSEKDNSETSPKNKGKEVVRYPSPKPKG